MAGAGSGKCNGFTYRCAAAWDRPPLSHPLSLQQQMNAQYPSKNKGQASDHPAVTAMSAKQALRRHFRAQRRLDQTATRSIQDAVMELIGRSNCGNRHVGIYWPLSGEADLRPLRDGHHPPLALPVADGNGGLIYRCWSQEPLEPDGCGIPAPAKGDALQADQLALLLVPALAVDGVGIRLGYGGGYYDRLRADPAWAAVPAWVVLPSACIAAEPLPREPWDLPFTGWITEQGAGRPA